MSSPTCLTLPVASGGCSDTLKPGNPDTALIGLDPGKIRCGENLVPYGFRDFDAADAGMRQRAADEGHVLHSRQADVADKLAQAPHQALVFLARQPAPTPWIRSVTSSAPVNARRPRAGVARRGQADRPGDGARSRMVK